MEKVREESCVLITTVFFSVIALFLEKNYDQLFASVCVCSEVFATPCVRGCSLRLFTAGLWMWSPSNFGYWSLKIGFRFQRLILWEKPVVRILRWILVFDEPNCSEAGVKRNF